MKYTSGLFLGVVFLFVFAAILMLLSSVELQNAALDSKNPSNLATTLGSIKSDVKILDAVADAAQQRANEIPKLEDQNTTLLEENNDAFDAMTNDEKKLQGILRNYADKTPNFPRNLSLPARPTSNGSDPISLDDRLDAYYGELDVFDQSRTAPSPTNWDALVDALHTLTAPVITNFVTHRAAWEKNGNELTKVQSRLALLKQPVAAASLPDNFRDANYKSLVEDFQENEWLFGFLVFIPHTMLVLLLALSMGMLGSLIFLARDLALNDETRGIGEMSFRIGLGAAVALALFCFASAGVLSLSASDHSTANMSPYLISFLGITAGYLSDRVTAWMREVGEKTFKVENTLCPDRWGVGLSNEISKQAIDKTQLAKTTGQSVADIDNWCSLSSAVPCAAQSALACYLRVNPSGLFTDINPN